jgi:hypothetical protein
MVLDHSERATTEIGFLVEGHMHCRIDSLKEHTRDAYMYTLFTSTDSLTELHISCVTLSACILLYASLHDKIRFTLGGGGDESNGGHTMERT